jgi:histidinol-phosphate aminotransferase
MVPNAVVVADEAYIEFADDYREQTARRLIDQADNVIVTRTFSKAYGIPNLRVGYGLGPADAIDFLFKIKPKWNVGEIAQQAAIGALRDRDHFEKVLRVVREGRRYLSDRLAQIPGLQIVPEPQGNFIMVRVRGVEYSAEAFTEALGAEGIIIRGDFHPDYVRISIGTQAENEALVKAIYKIIECP